jgi:hypothetical protein
VISKSQYHLADVRSTIVTAIKDALDAIDRQLPETSRAMLDVVVAGSSWLALSQWLSVRFVHDVVASTAAVKRLILPSMLRSNLAATMRRSLQQWRRGAHERHMRGRCRCAP